MWPQGSHLLWHKALWNPACSAWNSWRNHWLRPKCINGNCSILQGATGQLHHPKFSKTCQVLGTTSYNHFALPLKISAGRGPVCGNGWIIERNAFSQSSWCALLRYSIRWKDWSYQPRQGKGKDQASGSYKWLPCTWKWELSLADSSGAELHRWHNPSFPSRFKSIEVRGSIPHWRCANTTGSHMLQLTEHKSQTSILVLKFEVRNLWFPSFRILHTSRPVATGRTFWGSAFPNFFCVSPNFVGSRKVCFKHIVKVNSC